MTTFTTKIGQNRGRGRIWLEGQRLQDMGWIAKGTTYTKTWSRYGVLVLIKQGIGYKDGPVNRVSGKGDHPVIDITSKQVSEFFAGYTHVMVYVQVRTIAIVGVNSGAE